jgi:hypothetical protein
LPQWHESIRRFPEGNLLQFALLCGNGKHPQERYEKRDFKRAKKILTFFRNLKKIHNGKPGGYPDGSGSPVPKKIFY